MTKIYEALEHAYRERKELENLSGTPPSLAEPLPEYTEAISTLRGSMEQEMLNLYKSIDCLLRHAPKKVIQFIGSREGEGTSTVVREFAKTAALKIGKSVLLLDADRVRPCQHLCFGIPSKFGWLDAIKDGREVNEVIFQVEKSGLFIGPSSNSAAFTPEFFDFHWMDKGLGLLKRRFDLVLIDSPPITTSPDGLAIAPKVDGVVIVFEADKTRWTVTESLKERIEKVGGNILGVVFNKRLYHIPESIYKLL